MGNASMPGLKPTYFLTRRIFLSFLGLIYLAAFVSLAVQIKGLVGSHGILPAAKILERIALQTGAERYWYLPTLFWLNSSDLFLQLLCYLGAGLSLLLAAGFAQAPILFLLWLFYLSLFNIGNVFLGYQWDILLLEVGFLSIFFAPLGLSSRWEGTSPPSTPVLWLLRWVLFRLMFQSGMVKWLSGDPAWHHFTALQFHYETQPLPTWIGYYAHQLPAWFQRFSCVAMFIIELAVPFLIFTPRRLRMAGGFILIGFQVLIMATGNYNFFNLLTIALCLLLFDDLAWPRRLREIFFSRLAQEPTRTPRYWSRFVILPLCALILVLSLGPSERRLFPDFEWPTPLQKISEWLSPLHLVNGYGLFAVMTQPRDEITIEGSRDGKIWLPYEFKWKPGDLQRRPGFVEPHQPRLDWQMWFAALEPYRPHSWFQNFMIRLLEASPEVLALLKTNPFPDHPPRYLRAMISTYHFTDLATKHATGRWWEKGEERPYSPVLSLRE
jgi:lipase maturation factor 1